MISSLPFSAYLLLLPQNRSQPSVPDMCRPPGFHSNRACCVCSTLDSHESFRTNLSQPALLFISYSPLHIWAGVCYCQSFCTTGRAPGLATVCPPLGQVQRMSFVINLFPCYSSQQLAWQHQLPLRSSIFLYLPCHPILLAPLQRLPSSPAYLAI